MAVHVREEEIDQLAATVTELGPDLAVVQAVILTVTVVMVAANLLVDILHILIDPRLGGFSRSLGKPA